MNTYRLPEFADDHARYVFWDNMFTEEELYQIQGYCSSLELGQSETAGDDTDGENRRNNIAWFGSDVNDVTQMIYGKMAFAVNQINKQFYNFDLTGFHEQIQYSEYEPGDHYASWHTDTMDPGVQGTVPRKLTLSMQLSKETDYHGGRLQLKFGQDHTTFEKDWGKACFFPSYSLHRVTPVTKGLRKSLQVWVGGPPFK